ncbi:MAG: RloB family protein [Bacteroidota bacterium]
MPKRTSAVKVTDVRSNKPWLKKIGVSKYPVKTIPLKKTFLIVCEGQTEEMYFRSFPVVTAVVKSIQSGSSKKALVDRSKELKKKGDYDEVWCVFDMDYKPDRQGQYDDYNNAIQLALMKGFKCAYSNDAFELWCVLHYDFIEQEHLRTFYYEKLSEYWKFNYEKHGKERKFSNSIYNKLKEDKKANQLQAIASAKKLYERQEGKPYHLQNPVTKVYELVESLNKHIRA